MNVTNVATPLSLLILFASSTSVAAPDKAAPAPAATAPAPAPAAAPGGKPAGPPKPWKTMSAGQRGKYMKDVVMPRMKAAFQQHDPDEFEKFGCDTCHGDNPKARKFKMPSPDIYALPGTPAGFAPLLEKKPKMMKFMGETVKPAMAALLGLPEFDPKKPEAGGFGCTGCHTVKKE